MTNSLWRKRQEPERSMKVQGPLHVVCQCDQCKAQPEQEPEFIKHEVESAEDWSEWVCPNPHKYLMKCCDCGLVHEAQFSVVRYKSEEEREACDFVDDPNMQAVFRMRRSEQWSPEDTAHRAGGLPMEQPAQQEPVAWMMPDGKTVDKWALQFYGGQVGKPLYTTPPQRTWVGLTDEERNYCVDTPFVSQQWVNIEAKLKEKNA